MGPFQDGHVKNESKESGSSCWVTKDRGGHKGRKTKKTKKSPQNLGVETKQGYQVFLTCEGGAKNKTIYLQHIPEDCSTLTVRC